MTRIRFEDLPSTNTPRNAENLNKLNNVVISSTEPTTGEEVWIDDINKKIYTKNDNGVYEEFYSKGVTLYENSTGSSGNITLSDSVANYTRIKIFYKTKYGISELENSHEYYNPNNKTIVLMQTDYDGYPSMYHTISSYNVSSNTITFMTNITAMIRNNVSPQMWSAENAISIFKVIGFK